jgi:hypothetical protein
MATILSHDGTKTELIGTKGKQKALTLKQMQEAVGGYIEHVYDPAGKLLMVINEEGQYIDAPINEPARALIAQAFGTSIHNIVPIRGNVILCTDLGDEVA